MRTNITISIDVEVLGRFDELRGKISRGDYIGSLIGSGVPAREMEALRVVQKPRKSSRKTPKVADSGKKGLGSQSLGDNFVSYFKETKV